MNRSQVTIGLRVRITMDFSGVPKGTEGVIDENYTTGVMVAWDLPDQPLPVNYKRYYGIPLIKSGILRDGFANDELEFLEIV